MYDAAAQFISATQRYDDGEPKTFPETPEGSRQRHSWNLKSSMDGHSRRQEQLEGKEGISSDGRVSDCEECMRNTACYSVHSPM